MLINKASLNAVFNGLKTIFNQKLKEASTDWKKTTMVVPSTGAGEDHIWVSRFPKMRKWVGEKFIKFIEAGKYYKKNEDWESTVVVKRNDIEDDNIGIYSSQAQMAGESAAELEEIISDDLKNNAFTETCWDNQYYYDNDHPVGKTTVSNKLTAVLSAATPAAALASYGLARQMLMEFKDEEGMPLRLMGNVLEVGPALESVARKLCYNEKLDDNSPNPYKGTAEVLVNPGILSATQWMLHDTRKTSVKPFMIQMRKKPVFVSQVSDENEDVFMKGEFKFGAEARATGLYGFWQLSVGSTGAG